MSKLSEALARARNGVTYLTESIVLDYIYEIDRIMTRRGMSQADLAKKVESSPAYISKVLRGEGNLTVKTLVTLASAVGARVSLRVTDIANPLADMEWHAVNDRVYFPNEVKNYEALERAEWKEAA